MNYAEYIFSRLKSFGVGHVFMLSGGGCMYLVDALGRSGIPFTCCLHEQAAAIAALAYAQYSGQLGVVLVTSGPGSTNAVTGVAAAWTESVPLLVLSGQVKRTDIGWLRGIRSKGVQETPISEIVKPITKYAVTMLEPSEVRMNFEKAIHSAMSGRKGPVWLDVPLDIQSFETDYNSLSGYTPPDDSVLIINNEEREKLNSFLLNSKRPVILAGYGIRASGAADAFIGCVSRLRIPVLTTWKAIDLLPDNHPYYIGRPGVAGQRAANLVIQNADLLICIGARLDSPQIGYEQQLFAREAKKVIVDIDPAELVKWSFDVDMPICSDVGSFIAALSEYAAPECAEWLEHCAKLKHKYPLVPEDHYVKTDYASLYVLAEEISNQITADDIIVPGSSGMGSDVSYQVTRIKDGQRMLNSPGLGSMGFGVPSSLGACIASGGRRTLCINGDGGFQMNIQDLETIKSLELPIKFFVINNNGYGSIRNTQRNYFNSHYVGSSADSGVSLPNLRDIGAAYGYNVFQIKHNNEIPDVVRAVLSSPSPAICEVLVDPDDTLQFRASSILLPDGTSQTAPIEDLFPRLPRKELYAAMFINPVNALGVNLCNIMFDLDGTLVNSSEGILASTEYALNKLGYPPVPKETICGTIGLSLIEMMRKLLPGLSDEAYKTLSIAYREHYSQTGVMQCNLYPGIDRLIKELYNEFDLYIVTSKPTIFAEKILESFNLAEYFRSISGVELTLNIKKKHELIAELIDKYALDCAKTIIIGDRGEDVIAGELSDIKAVGVSYGYGERRELASAMRVANSVDELRLLLY